MSYGSIKTGPDQYLDLQTNEAASREWFAEQEPVDLGIFGRHEFPEEIQKGVNRIIGELLADIFDASFVSETVLNTVHIPEDFSSYKFPGGTTLPIHRLSSVIHNKSGEIVRQLINLSSDEELIRQTLEIEPVKNSEAPSVSGLFFRDEYFMKRREEITSGVYRTNAFNNLELLNQEATELLNLLGESLVEAVRDYIGLIAIEILVAAARSYEAIYSGAVELRNGIKEGQIDKNAEYSTLRPVDLSITLNRSAKMPILGILGRLPQKEANALFKRFYGFELPESEEVT